MNVVLVVILVIILVIILLIKQFNKKESEKIVENELTKENVPLTIENRPIIKPKYHAEYELKITYKDNSYMSWSVYIQYNEDGSLDPEDDFDNKLDNKNIGPYKEFYDNYFNKDLTYIEIVSDSDITVINKKDIKYFCIIKVLQ